MKPIHYAGGAFAPLHDALMGAAAGLPPLDLADFDPALLPHARAVWADRVRTEFRSIQITTRFLSEVVGAGEALDIYAGAVDLVADEVRHTALCVALLRALGGHPALPEPARLADPPRFIDAPMPERALTTAIGMLLINETLSTAFIRDLAARCTHPAVRHVLTATLADEDGHGDFGRAYVARALGRFPRSTLPSWRHLVRQTLEPHRKNAARALADVPPAEQHLDAHPEPARAALGLFTPVRQALVFRAAEPALYETLRALDLLD